MPIGAGHGSWGRECVGTLRLEYRHVEVLKRSVGGAYWSWRWQLGGVRWRTAVGVLTPPSINDVSQRNLLELAMAADVRECFGTL